MRGARKGDPVDMEHLYDVAIVGGGIAGYTAALTAGNLLMDYLWLGDTAFGEKLCRAERVTNFPSCMGSGKDFAAALTRQMEGEHVALTRMRADGVYKTGDRFTVTCGREQFLARTVILAIGVEARGSVRGERELLGRGVSYCAVCDGALYRGKTIAAVLSSPKFAEEVRYLAQFAAKVYCVCRDRAFAPAGENIQCVEGVPLAVEGEGRVERLVLRENTLAVSGVFFLRDSAPPEAIAFGVKTKKDGHIAVDRSLSTNLEGLFAAGDVTGRPYQYAKAAGEGCVAAHSAKNFLKNSKN